MLSLIKKLEDIIYNLVYFNLLVVSLIKKKKRGYVQYCERHRHQSLGHNAMKTEPDFLFLLFLC